MDTAGKVLMLVRHLYNDYDHGIDLGSVLSTLPHFDSLRSLELVILLEERFDVWIELEEIAEDWTVSSLVSMVEKCLD